MVNMEELEYKIINLFWKMSIFGMFMWSIREASINQQTVFGLLGFLWIMHSFKISVVKTVKELFELGKAINHA